MKRQNIMKVRQILLLAAVTGLVAACGNSANAGGQTSDFVEPIAQTADTSAKDEAPIADAKQQEPLSIITLVKESYVEGTSFWELKNKDEITSALKQAGFQYQSTGRSTALEDTDGATIRGKYLLFTNGGTKVYYNYSTDPNIQAIKVVIDFAKKSDTTEFIDNSLKECLRKYDAGLYVVGQGEAYESICVETKTPTKLLIGGN